MRLRAAILLLLLCISAGAAVAQPAMIVLDASASMWGRHDNRSRIDVARQALAGLMAQWDASRPVGLMAFGHRRTQDCGDAELLAAPGAEPGVVAALAHAVIPRGRASMADALRQAADALGPRGGSIILLSDGIDTCHPDPCAIAQDIARSGARIVVHTIGFTVTDPAAIAQLRCMAEATGGHAMTAADADELAGALARAAASAVPGPRAAAPRAESVRQPRLIVTLRLCPSCDPMSGDATILLHRDDELVATDGEPFGRFADLPPGTYAVRVATAFFTTGPVPATVPGSGAGRVTVVLNAGWLVGDVRSEPSGRDVTPEARVTWQALSDLPPDAARHAESQGGSPAFLVPTGTHRLTARIGNAEGAAETAVMAGEVAVLRVPIRFGTLALRREGFGDPAPHVIVTALADDRAVLDAWPAGDSVAIPLAPGSYRVSAEHDGRYASAEIEIAPGATMDLTLRP